MRVHLFIPCLVDTLVPEVGSATAAVLARVGVDLFYPASQTCCGQPAFNAGHWEDARRVARQFLRAFGEAEAVVAPSGSCVSMVRTHYPRLFQDHPAELAAAQDLAGRVFELSEFLVRGLKLTDVGAAFPGRVTYHDSCHLNRELGIKDEPRALIRAVKGAELAEMEDSERCCGFGGVFSIKFPELSAAFARRKHERARETNAETIVVADPGCLIHLRGYLHRHQPDLRVLHLAQILAQT